MSEAFRPPHEQALELLSQRFTGIDLRERPFKGYAEREGIPTKLLAREVVRDYQASAWLKAELREEQKIDRVSGTVLRHITELHLCEETDMGETYTIYVLGHDNPYLSTTTFSTPRSDHSKDPSQEEVIAQAQIALVAAFEEGVLGIHETNSDDWDTFLSNLSVGEWKQPSL